METGSPFLRQRRGTRGGVHVDKPRAKETKKPWSASTLIMFRLRHMDDSLVLVLVFFVTLLASLVVQYRAELITQSSAMQNERNLRRDAEMSKNRSAREAINCKKSFDRSTLVFQQQLDEQKVDILRHKREIAQLKLKARKIEFDFQARSLFLQRQLVAVEIQRSSAENRTLDCTERLFQSTKIIEDLSRHLKEHENTNILTLLLKQAASFLFKYVGVVDVRMLT